MVTITNTSNNQSLQLSDHIEHEDLKENLEEQTRDAINILQLLEVELSANEDDEHTIRTVSIVEKILKSHLELIKLINQNYENIQQSFLRLLSVYQSIHQGKGHFYCLYQY